MAYVAAQGGPSTERAAIRRYVRGGFRDGLSLNPLFMEKLVSSQLPDAGRVPALYAYLVSDVRRVAVTVNWDSERYAREVPDSLRAPGGPLGHAWRRAVTNGWIDLGFGGSAPRRTPWERVHETAVAAVTSVRRTPTVRPLARDLVFVCRLAPDEGIPARPLEEATRVTQARETDLVISIAGDSAETWTAAALLTLWQPSVQVVQEGDATLDDIVSAAPTDGTLLVRGPHAEIPGRDLLALADAAAEGPVAPLWLGWDGAIASAGLIVHDRRWFHLLEGHPREDAHALGGRVAVPAVAGGTFARPLGADAPATARTLLDLVVRAPATPPPRTTTERPDTDLGALLAPTRFEPADWNLAGPILARRPDEVTLADGTVVPALRWAVKIAAPPGPPGEAWGDTHFARGLADALRRLGQEVVIDAYAARDRFSAYLDDVVLALRGPEPLHAHRDSTSILWIISHPDEIDATDVNGFDAVFAASASWARRASVRLERPVRPLLQCTDTRRFRPGGRPRSERYVFVGTARGIARPSVVQPVRAGLPVDVYGPDWRGYIPASAIVADGIANEELPGLYESARAVLNDHWPAMQREGFISNRLFDVVAAGGRAVSDDVDGIAELFGGAVVTYRSVPELLELLSGDIDRVFPPEEHLAAVSERVRREHSFDARARELLETALRARQ